MTREGWRRVWWVASLALALIAGTLALLWRGAEWGAGAAP